MIWAKLLSSRLAWAIVAAGLTFGYGKVDKYLAVRDAKKDMVSVTEIASLKSLVQALQAKERSARIAGESLQSKIADAEDLALQAEKELEEYVSTTTQNNQCVVDDSLLGKLRNK